MKTGDNIRLRADGRYEARYIKGRNANGKIIYGYCYGQTYDEAKEKRNYQLQRISHCKQLNLLIFGEGDHGHDAYDIAKSTRVFNKISFLDDNPARNALGKWQDYKKYLNEYPVAIVAVGDEETRRTWTKNILDSGFILPTLVHPTAFVPDGVSIGVGSIICARVTISTGVHIGKSCIITSGSTIPRKTSIPDWSYFDFDTCIEHYHEEYDIPITTF